MEPGVLHPSPLIHMILLMGWQKGEDCSKGSHHPCARYPRQLSRFCDDAGVESKVEG
jgi:hypothetical protein